MKSGGHLISCTVMAMVLVWASTAYGEIYLYANGEDVELIELAPYESCTFEIVSNDYIPYYTAYFGWDWFYFFNGPVFGTFTLSEIKPEAGDMAEVYLYDDPGLWYLYEVVAAGDSSFPEPGIHFVFDYVPDQTGETDLLLLDEYYSNIIDSIHIYVGSGPGDLDSPSPDPMTWASPPDAAGIDSVTMTATTASDANSVEYYFQCVSGGGNDSDWQSDTTYVDISLQPGTTYTYKAKARDLSGNLNETAYSSPPAGATTDSGVEPPSGFVGWWPGDGHADDIWSDNHGTLMNGATFAAGKVGQAFSLDGAGDYVQIPYDASFNLSDFTLQAWVKFTQDTYACIISRPQGGNPTDGYSSFSLNSVSGKIGGAVQGEGGGNHSTSSAGSVFYDDTWHLCTFVHDIGANRISIYVDAYGPWWYYSSPGGMEHNLNGINIGSLDGSQWFFEGNRSVMGGCPFATR